MTANLFGKRSASESLGLVADWAHALNEKTDLENVLRRLARLVHAETVAIVRISKESRRTRFVARFSEQTGKVWPTPPQSHAERTLGGFVKTAKPGSVWKLTDATPFDHTDTSINKNKICADPTEAVVSPLETTNAHADFLEFHFCHHPAEHDLNLLLMLLSTLALGWSRRNPAMASKCLSKSRRLSLKPAQAARDFLILDSENPAKLSRSEYRICSLLKEGMTVFLIADSLSIRRATVRSHLSSIYSKTGLSGQVQLLHELNRTSDPVLKNEPSRSQRMKSH